MEAIILDFGFQISDFGFRSSSNQGQILDCPDKVFRPGRTGFQLVRSS